ncbi:hypothetical protein KNU20_gp61 [Gordonia phage Geodirt]|uniref:Uncharacterized protein n=1 Tax=Gordonia phage Geodirt TaxID=2483670 RepID=A0A3G3MAF6_9CAUD|nr:hypothetical protein KNU20_gp61 [Gordonia phage Geodirt]AYR02954.1 hypothetical protein SEA_GEODIRT_61 [Gordonia phage Geodirt]
MTDQKPSTPPAGPSGVSRPQDNADVQQALRRVNDVIGGALRQIAAITGQPDPAPPAAPAPNHLDAMRTAWDEGYDDGLSDGSHDRNVDPENPYAKLLDDRRAFVSERVDNAFGSLTDVAGDDVLGDDNAEWFDAVLDAHDEWRALQRHTEPQPADTWRDDVVNVRIRAEQAEARVAALDSVLRQLLIAVSPGRDVDVRFEDMLDEVRVILDRAGFHEHVHTRLATADDAPVELCGDRFDGFVGEYTCTEPAGHTGGVHRDGQHGTTWVAEEVVDHAALPGCTSTHALGIAVYTCLLSDGHEGYHHDKRYGVAWAADGSSSWRVK